MWGMTTPVVDTIPPPASSGEAFAALDHAHQQLLAAEVAEVIAIAHAADLYEVDQASIGQGIERLLGYGNDLGLFSEEYDTAAQRQVGNFPQAFTHVGLVSAGMRLRKALEGGSAKDMHH